MAVQVISASGTQFGMLVNSDGSINVDTSTNPQAAYNPRTIIQYAVVAGGSVIGSIFKNTTTGSIVKVLTYDSVANLITVGSWVTA